MKRKKWLYRKALNDKTDESWKLYKEPKKIAKQVVREAKEKDLVREGKMLQKDYLSNRRRFWQKVKGEERAPKTNASIETKDGKVLTGKKEVHRRWREHFSELFQNDRRDCGRETQGDAGSNELDDKILMEETRRVIGKLKRGKAGGVCDIRSEMLKAGEVTVQWLTAIFNAVWRTGVTPKEWRRAIIIPVHKKGSRRVCKNYRGISLLSVPGKVFGKILNDRMRNIPEGKIMEAQVGFRAGRGCVENVFMVRQLAEKMLERGKRLYAAFLDLEKAYDRVWRAGLWEALKQYGVKGRLLRAVQGLYKDSEATVKVGEEITD